MGEVVRDQVQSDQLPFAAPCNKLSTFAALHWLTLGWRDFRNATRQSLVYGSVILLLSYLLAISSWYLGGAVLLFSLLSGIVFIAPVFAIGLYSISCQLEAGYQPKLAYCMREGKRHLGDELVFSVILLIVFLLWTKAGSGVHIFFPIEGNPSLVDYLTFYAIGSLVGSLFAIVTFCASAFSLPMMMDRKADTVTAVVTSTNAVLQNKLALAVWAVIIGLGVLLCVLTAMLAVPIVLPVLGYATWHAYKQTINAELWPLNRKLNRDNPGTDKFSL